MIHIADIFNFMNLSKKEKKETQLSKNINI